MPLIRNYGRRFYGGSGVKRNNVREVAERPFFFEHPVGPQSSKASFNPKATVLPQIASKKLAKSVEEISRENPKHSRINFSKIGSARNRDLSSPVVVEDCRVSSSESSSQVIDPTVVAAAAAAVVVDH